MGLTIAAMLLLLAVGTGCQPQPSIESTSSPPEWKRRLVVFASYEVVVLNPWEAWDRRVVEEALSRAEPVRVPSDFVWLPMNPIEGGRSYANLVSQSDGMEARAQLKSCLKHSSTPSDTTRRQLLVLRVRAARDGAVLQAGVHASTLENPDIIVCLMQTVVGWRLGNSSGEETFDIPLVLIPSPHER